MSYERMFFFLSWKPLIWKYSNFQLRALIDYALCRNEVFSTDISFVAAAQAFGQHFQLHHAYFRAPRLLFTQLLDIHFPKSQCGLAADWNGTVDARCTFNQMTPSQSSFQFRTKFCPKINSRFAMNYLAYYLHIYWQQHIAVSRVLAFTLTSQHNTFDTEKPNIWVRNHRHIFVWLVFFFVIIHK